MVTHEHTVRNSSVIIPIFTSPFSNAITVLFDSVETLIFHCADDIYQRSTKGYMWRISIKNHRSILLMKQKKINGGSKIPILEFTKYQTVLSVWSTSEICRKIFNIFWGGIRNIKILYKYNWEKYICIVLAEIVVLDSLFLVLIIPDIGFRGDGSHEMLCTAKGESRLYL